MNRPLKRQLWLLNTLMIYKKLSFKELQSKWKDSYLNDDDEELSLRTFHGHKQALDDLFNIKIKCDTKDGYRYYIEKKGNTDSALEWILSSFNINSIIGDAKKMSDRIMLENIPGGTEYLQDVVTAMKEFRELHIIYQSFKSASEFDCHFQPYAMKVARQRWYVIGNLIESKGIRTIALDRIHALEITNKKFTIPEDFSVDDFFADSVGIWTSKNKTSPQRVVIRSSPTMAKYIRSLPLHWTQEEIKATDEYVDFRYHVGISHELVLTLLSYGSSIQVLEPIDLRNDILMEIDQIGKRYKQEKKEKSEKF